MKYFQMRKEAHLRKDLKEGNLEYSRVVHLFLDCDWLREMQFLGNTVQKKGNLVQKRVTNMIG